MPSVPSIDSIFCVVFGKVIYLRLLLTKFQSSFRTFWVWTLKVEFHLLAKDVTEEVGMGKQIDAG